MKTSEFLAHYIKLTGIAVDWQDFALRLLKEIIELEQKIEKLELQLREVKPC